MDPATFENPSWHLGTPRNLRRIWRTGLKDLAILALALAVGEASIRLLLPQTSQYVFSPTLTGGHPIRYNSHGLRDVEFPIARPAKERRILCVGDSTTFGAGVSMDDTYPKQLERLLNATDPADRWFVINGGGQGSSVSHLLDFLDTRGMAYDPSIVVLGFSPTMLSVVGRPANVEAAHRAAGPENGRPFPTSAMRFLRQLMLGAHVWLHRSYLYVFLDAHIRRQFYRWGVIRDRMDKPDGAIFAYAFDVPGVDLNEIDHAYALFYAELERTKRFLDERRTPLVVLAIPSRFRISDHRLDNERGYDLAKARVEPLDHVAAMTGALGIPFVDLRPRLRQERQAMLDGRREWNDLFIPTDYAHLNATGMRLAADELLRTLNLPTAERTARMVEP